MTAITLSDKKLNRRIASRIYEQSNLFYRKIDRDQIGNSQPSFDSMLDTGTTSENESAISALSLPSSQSQENDTLNVNISSTGIAFTTQQQLVPGEYLLLRILLLSSMTAIMTCCRVVYCKPSNPYETDRYPYLIGAEFVNMTTADSELLNSHVFRKKKQHWTLNGTLITLITAILLNPLETLHLAMELSHQLLEILAHAAYLIFEYLEMGLDHVIEHAFHTDLHTTQVIVFYILMSSFAVALYFIGRSTFAAAIRLASAQRLFWSRKRASVLYYWSEQSTLDKFKIIGMTVTAIFVYCFFAL